ncbi:MAG: hypothetical protein U0075_13665 [Thermomicrobiales bacterium]
MTISQLSADRRSRTLGSSRRGLLTGLAATLLSAGFHDVAAKRKRKRKHKGRKRPDRPQDLPLIRADAQCTGANGAAVTSSPDGRIAQTFTALQSGELVRAELLFVTPSNAPGDYVLHLAPVDAFGFPTNGVLATATLPGAPSPDGLPTLETFAFPQPATVVAGTAYALVLSRPEVGIVGWFGRTDNGCAGRAFISDNRTAPFAGAGQNVDLVFTTFVRA